MPRALDVPEPGMPRRRLFQLGILAVAGAAVGATPACGGPVAVAAPQLKAALVGALSWLGGTLLDDGRAWLVGKGLDAAAAKVAEGTASVSAYSYPTGAHIAAVADSDGQTTYWTTVEDLDDLHNWLPRGWEAIGRAGEALEEVIGTDAARAALVPAHPGDDQGVGEMKQSTYRAADGGLVTVRFDGRGPAPVETVELEWSRRRDGAPWRWSFDVDPENPLFLK
ncbi:hypothetical protein [Blastococcus atacamensis]|uniref:hypothetical protein n=1 Tax=Blastococcus atacamensis TaxID=2070508 RepID=UPI000CEC1BE0|nr:hypothetical protein [Blastococcus atacamensis]